MAGVSILAGMNRWGLWEVYEWDINAILESNIVRDGTPEECACWP
jgi:hypothetical protein